MRATVFHATGDVRVEQVPDPKLLQPTDAIVRITHACICGSDLWFYRGVQPWSRGGAAATSGWGWSRRSARRSAP
jgi:threonine dehydrogenase-like Zn-dependent dehydrogenase